MPIRVSFNQGTYFDEVQLDCDYSDHVDCGDRPEPGNLILLTSRMTLFHIDIHNENKNI